MADINIGGVRLTPAGNQKSTGGEKVLNIPMMAQDSRLARGNVYTATAASTAISNTTTETAFDNASYTFPANALQAGDRIRIRAQGIATTTANSDTLTVKLYVGSNAVCATAAVDSTNSDTFLLDTIVTIRTDGASGTHIANGIVCNGVEGTATMRHDLMASTAINTTTTQAITCKATWSVADANDSCRLDEFSIDLL